MEIISVCSHRGWQPTKACVQDNFFSFSFCFSFSLECLDIFFKWISCLNMSKTDWKRWKNCWTAQTNYWTLFFLPSNSYKTIYWAVRCRAIDSWSLGIDSYMSGIDVSSSRVDLWYIASQDSSLSFDYGHSRINSTAIRVNSSKVGVAMRN